jgi:hypothetical protein
MEMGTHVFAESLSIFNVKRIPSETIRAATDANIMTFGDNQKLPLLLRKEIEMGYSVVSNAVAMTGFAVL